jgi:flagellar motor switch/type III secretory pathway protein FliN
MGISAKIRRTHVAANVVLCRLRFTLAELAALRAQDVLEVELADMPSQIELEVKGKVAAKGRLLIKDGLRWVEITELAKRSLRRSLPVAWTVQ